MIIILQMDMVDSQPIWLLTLTLKLMMTLMLTLTLSLSLLKLGSFRYIITSICMRRICWVAESFRYNVNGFVEELTQLPESRWGHSCAAIPSTGVRLMLFQSYQLLNPLLQEYIVAGGYIAGSTDSVLSLLPGASSWTTLASLPRTCYQARASLFTGNMRLAGGVERTEVRINNLPC